jgi:hypothetical protein
MHTIKQRSLDVIINQTFIAISNEYDKFQNQSLYKLT